jgi:hypothetical protein
MPAIPVRKNTVTLTCMIMIAAMGIVARLFIRIPVIPSFVEITPGFLFSELAGVIGGLAGGILVGATIGIGGAITGGEFPLMPMVGNVFLGIGTGYAIHFTTDRNSLRYAMMVILGGGFIGGFVPDMTVFLPLTESLGMALMAAVADTIQGLVWAAVALSVERVIVRPLIGQYLYAYPETVELENNER